MLIGMMGAARLHTPEPLPLPPVVTAIFDAPRLSGASRYTHWGFYICDAWLWTGSTGLDPATLAQPFAITLRYARDFSGPVIARRCVEEMQVLGLGTDADRAEWLRWLSSAMPDVEVGDVMINVFRPGAGLTLFLNDEPQATSRDTGLACAFFSTWLDVRTRSPCLRAALLAGCSPPQPDGLSAAG